MRLTFTKRNGKYDDLSIERDSGPGETLACPKQGIIPHDMVHYAVESTLSQGGFLRLVEDGRPAAFTTSGGDAEEATERLVEVFQAELWGGRVPVVELLATYRHACAAHEHPAAPVSEADIQAIRDRLDELLAQWSALPVNSSLTLTM
jgi:hypothetical protein